MITCQDTWREAEVCNEIMRLINLRLELELIEKLKPRFSKDGDQYCFLFGDNLQEGMAGFGSTVAEAVSDFAKHYYSEKA